MTDTVLLHKATQLIEACDKANCHLGTIESCTGGLIGGALTSVAGASKIFKGGLITYANEIKHCLAKVPEQILQDYGAVSAECAAEMVKGGQSALDVQLAIAVTGIAGPGGGTADKPVGLVYIGTRLCNDMRIEKYLFGDVGRKKVRHKTIISALDQALGHFTP